jgi:hypothetical protein
MLASASVDHRRGEIAYASRYVSLASTTLFDMRRALILYLRDKFAYAYSVQT